MKHKKVVAHAKTPAPSAVGGYDGAFLGGRSAVIIRTQQNPNVLGGPIVNPAPMDPTTVSS